MPSAEVIRSDSNRSDASQKPRVSFNRDVHVKRIVPRENSRISGAVTGINGETVLTSPVRRERVKRAKKELAEEAAKVINQADKVECVVSDKGAIPERYYTLPNRKRYKDAQKEYAFSSLDRRPNKRRSSPELQPPKKPPRTFANTATTSSKPSIFDIFKKPEKPVQPKKSNLRRSVSDASSLRSKAFGPVESNPKIEKRADSDSEETVKKTNKKQLSPIIEVTQREDYFATDNKENISIPEVATPNEQKHTESIAEQLKNYIEEIDEGLYKETGIRITTSPPKKGPEPIIIDLDKAENISSHKRHKLNFGLGKKLKSLTHKKAKTNENFRKNESTGTPVPKNSENNEIGRVNSETKNPAASTIRSAIEELEKPADKSPVMIHSSQKPVEKPPLTKGKTVNSMVKRLSSDACSSPPPTRTNVLIMPNMSVQHNNNQPFSYIRGISPDKYRSHEDLPPDISNITKPVIYAQVVCGAKGLSNEKQTIHTTYNGRRQTQSDSDEGLGGEDSSGFTRKYDTEKSLTRFGDEPFESYQSDTEKLLDEIDKYKAESPILPKYRSPAHFTSYNGVMERGRGDGMDAKRRESLTEADSPEKSFSKVPIQNGRIDLSTRRDLLESRMNRRISEKTTPSPEHYPNKTSRNVYVSEKSSNYYRGGSPSPVGYKEKYVSETKTDSFGERRVESRTKTFFGDPLDPRDATDYRYNEFLDNEPKSLESQISDYRSSPENRRFESSHNTNSRSRYRTEKSKLLKDKNVYRSTPEIHTSSDPIKGRQPHDAYHDSLPRDDKFEIRSSQRFRSERFLNREESDRRTDRFVDSGIENDCRRDSSENYPTSRPRRTQPDIYNESEDEGFASSLLITNEKNHSETTNLRKSRRDYDSDVNSRDEFYRHRSKYIPRERSIDDGSHYDPRIDKDVDRSTLKATEKKPPKPEKKTGLDKVKSLFTRDKKKEKTNTLQKHKTKSLNGKQEVEDNRTNAKNGPSPDYRNRRRLSTPSPPREMPKRSEPTHGSWFKSLDRLTKRKSDKHNKDGNVTSTEDEAASNPTKLSSSTSNLRFFGDTDQESNADSIRGMKPTKRRPGLRSQSTRDLHDISEEKRKYTSDRKTDLHHKSLTNISGQDIRDLKGSRASLKPPMSPTTRYRHDIHREDRRRRKRPEISSVESSTEGDSSQQSQRSIVYLHAATVGDIPGPGYLRSGGRAASREDLTSNGSSFIQPQVKTLSRSFSVLAPWRPRHQKEALDIDYTQYNKSSKNGKYEQKAYRNISNRNDNSTLKKKAQESRRSSQQTLNRKSRSKENLSGLRRSKEEASRGSTSTLYKKKDKLPRENSRYTKEKEDRKMTAKSQSVESISRKPRGDGRDVSRSVSMPRDTEKSAGWFKRSKKS